MKHHMQRVRTKLHAPFLNGAESATPNHKESVVHQSEGILERINESPWGRCLQGAVGARWVVVVVLLCCVVVVASQGGSGLTSSRALGSTVTLLRSNGDTSMGLGDRAM